MISRFFGIIIRMYFQQAEHNPPHIHAIYGEDVAAIAIESGNVLEGNLPPKELAMVRKWMKLHKEELLNMWKTQVFQALSPLE